MLCSCDTGFPVLNEAIRQAGPDGPLLAQCLDDRRITAESMALQLRRAGVKVSASTIRTYRRQKAEEAK